MQRDARRREGGFRRLEEIAVAAGSLLPRAARGRHLRALAAWRAAAGDRVDRATRFAGLEHGVMTIEVSDRGWGDSLARLAPRLLDRVQARLGAAAASRIEFRVQPGIWRPQQRVPPTETGAGTDARPAAPPSAGQGTAGGATDGNADLRGLLSAADLVGPNAALGDALRRIGNRYLARAARRADRQ